MALLLLPAEIVWIELPIHPTLSFVPFEPPPPELMTRDFFYPAAEEVVGEKPFAKNQKLPGDGILRTGTLQKSDPTAFLTRVGYSICIIDLPGKARILMRTHH
jgi:hypothetical protein